ncbi:MAG: sensor histidine kinase [Calditrichia bacterium]
MNYRILVFSTIFFMSMQSFAQNSVRFDHLSIEQGLSHTSVKDIAQDDAGFLWFATPDGLNRYDGYEFTRFRHDPEDEHSLPANSINKLYVDAEGVLWIATFSGLCRFDPVHEHFVRYITTDDSLQTQGDYISTIAEDRKGNLWIGRMNGLTRVNKRTGESDHMAGFIDGPFSLPTNNSIHDIVPDPFSNHLWLATSAGLNRFDPESGLVHHIASGGRYMVSRSQFHLETQQLLMQLMRVTPAVGALTSIADLADSSHSFRLHKPERVLLTMQGEGAGGALYDYGWLEDSRGRVIWKADYLSTRAAGGSPKNRLGIAVRTLPAGEYRLRYVSDDSHSFGKWNADPPKLAELWGISLFRLTGEMEAELEKHRQDYFEPPLIPSRWTFSLFADTLRNEAGEQQLWVGTGNGVSLITLPQASDKISRFYQTEVATRYFESEQLKLTNIELPVSNSFERRNFEAYDLLVTRTKKKRKLWVATANAGLLTMPLSMNAASSIQRYHHDMADEHSLSANEVRTVELDHSGNLWAGTVNGLNKLNPRKLQFTHHKRFHSGKVPGENFTRVLAIFEQPEKEHLWVATEGGGISRIASDDQPPLYFSLKSTDYPNQPNIVHSISRFGQSEILWLATATQGLGRFDTRTGNVSFIRRPHVFTEPDGFKNKLLSNRLIVVLADSQNTLWVGTERASLARITLDVNERLKTVRHYGIPMERGKVIPDSMRLLTNQIWTLIKDPHAERPTLWLGMVGGHLSSLDIETGIFTHYRSQSPPTSAGPNSKTITALHVDNRGDLWVGTYSGGVNRMDRKTKTFRHYTVRKGLSNNMVEGILEDDRGRIWISTNDGLSMLDPETEAIQTYDVNDGLQSNQFTRGASARTADGKLLFGGVNGLSCFYPDSLKESTSNPAVVLTDFKVFGRSVIRGDSIAKTETRFDFKKTLSEVDEIRLSYAENFFSFNFVALDYTNSLKNEYAYRLDGFDRGWIYCDDRRFASYTNLDPGSYTFRVKAANSDGVWNEEGVAVQISIMPPFWKTWWFYLFSACLLAGIAYGYHNYRLRQKVREMVAIERVRKKAAADFHDELGHKLTKISLFSEIVKRRLSEAPGETVDYVQRINDISGGLYNGMRDFLWTLDPGKDSLYEALIRLKDFGDEFFDKSGISFEVEGIDDSMRRIELTMDWKRHLVLLFKEAMTNVLKHSRGDNVLLRASLHDRRFMLELLDNGRGYTFSSPSQNGINGVNGSNGSHKTTYSKSVNPKGLGLKNMRFRAEQLSGEFKIMNSPDGPGTVVRFIATV